MRLLAVLALAAGLGCGSSTVRPGLGLSSPSGVATFQGVTSKNPGAVHPYVAIANTGKDELILIDALDDQPVLSPVVVRPLSVPVPQPRPAYIVSGALRDTDAQGNAVQKADLLAVVSSGTSIVQLIDTWSGAATVAKGAGGASLEVDLGAAAGGADVVALMAAPVPGATAGATVPGRVRVFAALSGGRLAMVTYRRADDGVGIVPDGQPVVMDLAVGTARFEAVGLAVNPADPRFLYVASPDPITSSDGSTTVLGVAQLDVSAATTPFPWRALSARAPTTAVAAWRLQERLPDKIDTFQANAVDRVYAALDPTACGPAFPIDCGVAIIDPGTGTLAPDPAGLMPYIAPIHLPATALNVVVSPPPQVGPSDAQTPSNYAAPFMRIAPGSGQRQTTAVAAIPSSDGRIYFADLARWAVPNNGSMLQGDTVRTGVSLVTSLPVDTKLGLWDPKATAPTVVQTGPSVIRSPYVTPGFTPAQTWTVAYQAVLPGLGLRKAQIGANGDGRPWVAAQVRGPSGGVAFTQVARLYGPELGVHVGDILEIETRNVTAQGIADGACPADDPATLATDESIIGTRIAEFLLPDATRPGGAVVLTSDPTLASEEALRRLPNGNATDVANLTAALVDQWSRCVNALGATPAVLDAVRIRIRASGFVLSGDTLGYAGRPTLVTAPNGVYDASQPAYADDGGFRLVYENEDALACPIEPWPSDISKIADCRTDACRSTCERLVLARKARRFYYVSDPCGEVFAQCGATWPGYAFPNQNGPAIAFKLGLVKDASVAAGTAIPRDTQIQITTRSGLLPASRGPTVSGAAAVLPTGVSTFDRSPVKSYDSYRFYASFASGTVVDFSPSQPPNTPVTLR